VPQFTLFALMKWMALAAVVMALATMPQQVATPILLTATLLIAPHLVLRARHGSRTERAFYIGLLTPLAGLFILSFGCIHAFVLFSGEHKTYLQTLEEMLREISHYRTHTLITWAFGLFSGATCWLAARRQKVREGA
jgi:hypothetical protein